MELDQKTVTVSQLVDLAMEAETHDPLPWGMVTIDQKAAYTMMAIHVIDLFGKELNAVRETVIMSVVTKLLVENFLLNVKINQDKS